MHELLPSIVFYVFAVLAVISAFLVITQNNPVRCVLFLVLAFLASAVLWLLVQAEFLALILVLVYVGAVMTLFLFVVMMLNIDVASKGSHYIRYYLPLGVLVVALLTGLLLVSINSIILKTGANLLSPVNTQVIDEFDHSPNPLTNTPVSNTEALGLVLYTDYVFAFELAAVILLVAIVASITLVHQKPNRSKRQNIVQQIMTRREDRVSLHKMKSEKQR